MKQRKVGPFDVSSVGLGCMSLSHAYGAPPEPAEAAKVLHRALDVGYSFLDTAALYGFGKNETLIGDTLGARRGEYILASKCGMDAGPDGKREINGRPERIRRTAEAALKRLKVEVIDLYYLHRIDPKVPVEESVGEMGRLLDEGKVRALGLSEASAQTLRRAHAERAICALQTEYSLWTRNPEVAALEECRRIGAAFVAFSPVGRGFLTGALQAPSDLIDGDIRRGMPRFQGDNFARNRRLVDQLEQEAKALGCTAAQLSLAWLLHRDEIIVPIPGTTRIDHLEQNAEADQISLSEELMVRLDELINPKTVAGSRYPAATQLEIDTEELAA